MDANALLALTGKKAVLFGAAGGIGSAVAYGLAQAGCDVALVDVNPAASEPLARRIGELGRVALTLGGDVTDAAQVAAAVTAARQQFGRLDIAVNLAFVSRLKPIVEMSTGEFTATIDTCLRGSFLVSQAVGRVLVEQGSGGSVIHFSSIAGAVALGRGTGAYAAAKAGINALVRELSVEWGPHRIRVNAIAPCQTLTAGLNQVLDDPRFGGRETLLAKMEAKIPLGRLARPEDMIGPCVFLASDAAAMVTGHILYVDGGYTAQ